MGIDAFVPKKILKNANYPKWCDPDLRKSIALKNRLYKKYNQSQLPSDYKAFSNV